MKMEEIKEIVEKHIEISNKYNLDDIYEADTDFTFDDYIEKMNIKKMHIDKKSNIIKNQTLIRILYNFFLLPMLFLHELSHVLMMLLLFIKPLKFFISNPINVCFGLVDHNLSNNYIKNILISSAPLILIILSILLPFIDIKFLFFTAYSILSLPVMLPSNEDLDNIKLFLLTKNNLNAFELVLIRNFIK